MEPDYLHIGEQERWGGVAPLRLSAGDRKRHIYVVGQTGVGKSTLFKNIFAQDVQNGAGVALIDPHGDLAHEALEAVPSHRVRDVVILDPSDINRPVGFNPLYRVPVDDRALVAANIVATFHHIWAGSWGPQLQYIFHNTVRALLDAPDALRPSFLSIPLVLVDKEYRKRVVSHVEDTEVRRFFTMEYERWSDREKAESIKSTQNKIGQFLANPFVRNIMGQWKPSIDLDAIMREDKILIVRLSKGLLGEEAMKLVGSSIASGFQQAAMKRAGVPEDERTDFHLLIDEFQNFATSSFEGILSEARKYSLTLCCGNQYIDQLTPEIGSAVFGNVGTVVSFRVGATDAKRLAFEIGDYQPQAFRDLSRGEICAILTKDGEAGMPCIGRTRMDAFTKHGHTENILHQSRQRYGTDRKKVEAQIGRWMGQTIHPQA